MSEFAHASEQLGWFLRKLSSMQAIADALEKAGSLEAMIAEKQTAADLARKEVITQEAVLAELKKKQEAAKKAAAASEARAAETATATLGEAQEQASQIIATATAKAKKIVGDAEGKVATLEGRARKISAAIAAA